MMKQTCVEYGKGDRVQFQAGGCVRGSILVGGYETPRVVETYKWIFAARSSETGNRTFVLTEA
jgi:hypothetical protein